MTKQNKIIIALDTNNFQKVMSLVTSINENIIFKVGMEFFFSFGYQGINKIKNIRKDIKIFLDLKLHDIPNTVFKAMKNLLNHKIWMTNIHLLGGEEMIQAAKEARETTDSEALLVGVSVLTSLNERNIKNMGFNIQISELVKTLCMNAKQNNIDGVVSSVKEVPEIKKNFGEDFITVTPGIRIEQKNDDQSRVATLEDAIKNGSDYIVLGREMTASENTSKMIKKIESYII